jgi:D-alanine-D-alanine ligase
MGGPSHEHAISLESGRNVCRVLSAANCEITQVVILENGQFEVNDGAAQDPCGAVLGLIEAEVDVAFLALHGERCEDGTLQGFMEWSGLPYTFSGVEASVLAMNKCAYKALLVQHGVATAPFAILDRSDWGEDGAHIMDAAMERVGLPAFLKASGLGSSYGVHRVETRDEAATALEQIMGISRQALWEKAVDGVELTAAVVGDSDGEVEALPIVEIEMPDGELFDTKNKYDGTAREIVPARISDDVRDELQTLAIQVHRLLGCRSVSRTDAILSNEGLVVLETNTIPGLTSESLFPKAAGCRFAALIRGMVDDALARCRPSGAAESE